MIMLKSRAEIEKMRAAGRVVARALREMSEGIVPGKTSPADLDAIAVRIVEEAGGTPSFLHYRGYPAATCISVNEVVIHGIPDKTALQEGDIVDLDLGVHLDGWHADGAQTVPVGKISPEAQRLLNVTQEALAQGIAKARIGNRIGDISAAVQRYAESNGYSVVRDLVGHGIGRKLHEEPQAVPNFGKPGRGEPLREGMTICIEPMINQGVYQISTDPDGWTMRTADGKLSAHFEHTVAITRDGPEILTKE
ncbi:MAG: type I methionyl aminopeptidase [Fimbriimonas ginsengisoli]|uniref:Methionine aminopeptidase n=1 Tax=Fimbriimonas ginsengisoli TaxID=1005039 RepID=A0A931PT58_FIMGI|nr:type I methionyl aminopeptidase [Fimbriimonas ginsengisoli]